MIPTMSTVATPARPSLPTRRLLTIADVAALPSHLPTGDVDYELDDGRLVIMAPPGGIHGSGQVRIGGQLYLQGELRKLGRAFAEVGIILRRNPDRLVGADAAFIAAHRLPFRLSPEGYLETLPDLAVEIRSKNDTWAELRDKVAEYLAAGVLVVWVLDPARRTVTEFRAGQAEREWLATDMLTIPDVIPGFQVLVGDLFD